jgi:hypothetical protein
VLPDEVGESVSGDLGEIFETLILPDVGRFRARLWYWRQVVCSLTLLFRFRANPHSTLKSWKGQVRMGNPQNFAVAYHSGIRIDKIRVEGAIGLLFVFATIYIFGVGIPAVRGLAAIAGTIGVFGSGALYYWHKRHALKNHSLNLHGSLPSLASEGSELRAGDDIKRP